MALTSAQLIGRLSFGPTESQLRQLGSAPPNEIIDVALNAPPVDAPLGAAWSVDFENEGWQLISWWLDVMRRGDAWLHERLVWFWHGHFTSAADKTSWQSMLIQHEKLRAGARGNFRQLVRDLTLDAAMLEWLDGNGSTAAAPNENHARELMELFTLGRHSGAYTEADVRAAAYAMSGWWADAWSEEPDFGFDPDLGPTRSVTVLGRSCRSVEDVIDTVCSHPACAPFIAGQLWEHFVGVPPSDATRRQLATVFAESDLEIEPLVRAMVTHPDFVSAAPRARSPLEWFLAVERLLGGQLDSWVLELLGQVPFNPPNVAGWPVGDRWLAGGAILVKANAALNSAWDAPTLADDDPVGDALLRGGIDALSESSRRALADATNNVGRRELSSRLLALLAVCPEFNVT